MSNNLRSLRAVLLFLFVSLSAMISAQKVTLRGTVIDSYDTPVIGASVVEKGTTNGTITDIDGNFTLEVDSKGMVTVSYIGMESQTVKVEGKTTIKVVMSEGDKKLDEVVVIGYGTVSKKDLTGSVSSVSAAALAAVPVTNAAEAITGRMAGVQVTTTEGSPDAEVKIRVRGGGSISQDNSPLYIVDGFPVSGISDIAPSDIESISILKDASTTAIYGARGANGVILVTTKSGQEGKVKVAVGASYGIKKMAKTLDVLNPYEYVRYQYELDPETSNTATTFNKYYGKFSDLDIYKSDAGINWQDEVFGRTGAQQNYNVSVSGGNKDTKFNISYTRAEEKSIMIGSGFEKNNVNAKVNTNINDALKMDFNARLSYQVIDGASVSTGSGANTKLRNAVKYAPTKGLAGFDSSLDDEEGAESSSNLYNPVESVEDEYRKQRKFSNNYNAGLNWKIAKGLSARAEGGYGFAFNNTDNVYGPSTSTSKNNGGQPILNLQKVNEQNWRQAVTLTYDTKDLTGIGDRFDVMIGQEATSSQTTKTIAESRYYPSDMTNEEILATPSYGKPLPTTTVIGAPDNMFSYFARANYTLFDKYMFTATFRADGSSKFAKQNRWGYFPSAAVAWRVSDEAFMEGASDYLSNLKLRLSWGNAGNNRIPETYKMLYSSPAITDKFYYAGEEIQNQLDPSTSLPNPDLKWETTITRNVGLDYGFFNGRLSGTIDLYWNTTKDLLVQSPVASSSGYKNQYRNLGQTSNKGVEFAIDGVIVDTKDFTLSAAMNISFNKNVIDKFSNGSANYKLYTSGWNGSSEPLEDYLIMEGKSVGQIYGYVTDGMYTFDDFTFNETSKKWVLKEGVVDNSTLMSYGNYYGPGSLKLKDLDGDGKITTKDKTIIGNTNPIHTGGFNVTARYKGFDLGAYFNWSYGNDVYNANKIDYSCYMMTRKYQNISSNFALSKRFTTIDPVTGHNVFYGTYADPERLKELNQDASIWSPLHTGSPLHSWAVEDGSFLRLSTLTIGYSLPASILKKVKIESLRVYATGYNLFCWTNYSGFDPEVDTRRSTPMTPNVDYSAYPKSRTYMAGINLTF